MTTLCVKGEQEHKKICSARICSCVSACVCILHVAHPPISRRRGVTDFALCLPTGPISSSPSTSLRHTHFRFNHPYLHRASYRSILSPYKSNHKRSSRQGRVCAQLGGINLGSSRALTKMNKAMPVARWTLYGASGRMSVMRKL